MIIIIIVLNLRDNEDEPEDYHVSYSIITDSEAVL